MTTLGNLPHSQVEMVEKKLEYAFNNRADQYVRRINLDPRMAEEIAALIDEARSRPRTPYELAREIMGKNCLLQVAEERKLIGDKNSDKFQYVPWSENCLEELRGSHVLVYVPPLSISSIMDEINDYRPGLHLFETPDDDRLPTHLPIVSGWFLVQKTALSNSQTSWERQERLYEDDEERPVAQVVFWAIMAVKLQNNTNILHDAYLRCADVILGDIPGHTVIGFGEHGIQYGTCREEHDFFYAPVMKKPQPLHVPKTE